MTDIKKKILVTGGTGLVGSHLLYALTSAGEKPRALFRTDAKKALVKKVFGYYSEEPGSLYDSIEWVQADLNDAGSIRNAMKGSVQVYNCAAQVSFDPLEKDKIIIENVRITENIVQSCLEHKGTRLCHVSSNAAIGGNSKGLLINEDQEWDDSVYHAPYSVSKLMSEKIVWDGIKKGLKGVIVNPSIIFGPGDWEHGSSVFFSVIRKGLLFYTRGVTAYVDVRDVAASMIRLMNSSVSGERFLITSDNISFIEIFRMISENLGVRKPFIYTPRIIAVPAMKLMNMVSALTGLKSPVTSDNLLSAYDKNFFDNSKIIRETGISFISVRKSIEDTCRLFIKDMAGGMKVIQ